jgi:hypothetical protein
MDKQEVIYNQIDIEYKIAVLKGKIDNALKENNKASFLRCSKELIDVEDQKKYAEKYNKVFFTPW